jgi:hypothetical protein
MAMSTITIPRRVSMAGKRVPAKTFDAVFCDSDIIFCNIKDHFVGCKGQIFGAWTSEEDIILA